MKFLSPDFLADSTNKLTSQEVAELFPRALRYFPQPSTDIKVFEFLPQPGAMTSFGVFFYALTDKDLSEAELVHRLRPGEQALLVDTYELLQRCVLDQRLSEDGVLAFPSQAYIDLVGQIARDRGGISPYELDETIQRNNVVVNLRTVVQEVPPVLSIPAPVRLTTDVIMAQWKK